MAGGAAAHSAILSEWQANLAIMAANHVPGGEAAMVKLGDRLWLESGEVGFAPVYITLLSSEASLTLVMQRLTHTWHVIPSSGVPKLGSLTLLSDIGYWERTTSFSLPFASQ